MRVEGPNQNCQQTCLISFSVTLNLLELDLFVGFGVKGTVEPEGTRDIVRKTQAYV